MLTDAALRSLKPKKKMYKASDRDGMYVTVQPSGTIVFRFDYRLNDRRETLTLGRYGAAGLSLGDPPPALCWPGSWVRLETGGGRPTLSVPLLWRMPLARAKAPAGPMALPCAHTSRWDGGRT